MDRPNRSVYTAQDFEAWNAASGLSLTPKFQRRGVWKSAAKSFFIDSLLRAMPVPPIYIRVTQSPNRDRIIREVVDGQQRVAAVLNFIDGQYRLSRNLNASWAGKTFSQLTPAEQNRIKTYDFSAEVFQGISDLDVLEVFSRLNTYSVPLNAQELRNGKFFGYFKQVAYKLAYEHLEFWRRHGAFSERSIARMLEVEFVSEVMIAQLAGMQDKKKSIDTFYERFDEKFAMRTKTARQFRDVADQIDEAFPDGLSATEFRRSPLLYSLFCAVHHHGYGLANVPPKSPMKSLSKSDQVNLRDAVYSLTDQIEKGRAKEPVPQSYVRFVAACLSQTDNIQPRTERFRFLYRTAFGT